MVAIALWYFLSILMDLKQVLQCHPVLTGLILTQQPFVMQHLIIVLPATLKGLKLIKHKNLQEFKLCWLAVYVHPKVYNLQRKTKAWWSKHNVCRTLTLLGPRDLVDKVVLTLRTFHLCLCRSPSWVVAKWRSGYFALPALAVGWSRGAIWRGEWR